MKVYTRHSKQNLPISVNDAWDFISNPSNLSVITPTSMNFQIQSDGNKPMYAGQIIEYLVTPGLGIRTKWVTEITHLSAKNYFVDEQRFGPYAFWHHKHFIKEVAGGVEMEDLVHYALPFGILGRLAHRFMVKPKLDTIFQFRKNKLEEIFGKF